MYPEQVDQLIKEAELSFSKSQILYRTRSFIIYGRQHINRIQFTFRTLSNVLIGQCEILISPKMFKFPHGYAYFSPIVISFICPDFRGQGYYGKMIKHCALYMTNAFPPSIGLVSGPSDLESEHDMIWYRSKDATRSWNKMHDKDQNVYKDTSTGIFFYTNKIHNKGGIYLW